MPLNSLEFDGTNDRAVVAGGPFLTSTQAFTLEMWLKPAATQTSVVAYQETVGVGSFSVILRPDRVSFSIVTHNAASDCAGSSDGPVQPNVWTHVAWTFVNNTLVFYQDGQFVFEQPNNGMELGGLCDMAALTSDVVLGVGSDGLGAYSGRLADFRLWSVNRTQEEIQRNMNHPLAGNEPGLALYLPLPEGSGLVTQGEGAVPRATSLGNGDATQAPQWNADSPFVHASSSSSASGGSSSGGVVGPHALRFDGVNDLAVVPGERFVQNAGAFTLEMWVKPDANLPNTMLLYQRRGASSSVFSAQLFTNRVKFSAEGTTDQHDCAVTWQTPLPAQQWTHVAWSMLNNTLVYVQDGAFKAESQTGGMTLGGPCNMLSVRNDLILGNDLLALANGISGGFAGAVAEVRVWNVSRSVADIQAQRSMSLSGTEPGLVLYLPMLEGSGVVTASQGSTQAAVLLGNGTADQAPAWSVERPY